jgi:hypothetical protein
MDDMTEIERDLEQRMQCSERQRKRELEQQRQRKERQRDLAVTISAATRGYDSDEVVNALFNVVFATARRSPDPSAFIDNFTKSLEAAKPAAEAWRRGFDEGVKTADPAAEITTTD